MILDTQILHSGGKTKLYGTQVGGERKLLNELHYPYFYSLTPVEGKAVKSCEPVIMKRLSNCQDVTVYKITVFYSGSVKSLSNDADFENHILYENRFIVDEGIKQDDIMPKMMAYDIECLAPDEHSFPLASRDPIISISIKTEDEEIVVCDEDEKKLLLDFKSTVRRLDCDIITTYNGNLFDNNYVMARCKINDISDPFSRYGFSKCDKPKSKETGKIVYKWFFPGRCHFDAILSVFDDQSLNAKTKGRGLKAVGKYFYDQGDIEHEPIQIEESIHWLWHNDREKLKEYNLRDSVCTYEIAKNIYFPRIVALAKELECDLQRACYYNQSWINEIEFAKEYNNEGILCDGTNLDRFPNVFEIIYNGTGKPQGALSGIRKRAMYWNVSKFDFLSFYPFIAMEFDISIENTKLVEVKPYNIDEYCIEDYTSYYRVTIPDKNCNCNFVINIDRTKKGILAKIEERLFKQRQEIRDKGGPGSKSQQWAVKIIMNAIPGMQRLEYSTRTSILCSILILGIARHNTMKAIEICDREKANVIQYDTDGCLVSSYFDVNNLAKKITEETGLEMEYEDSFQFAIIYKPKNYIIKRKDILIVHGAALRGKQRPKCCDIVLEDTVNLFAKYYHHKDIIDKLLNLLKSVDMLSFKASDYMVNTTLGRAIEDYKVATPACKVAVEMQKRGSTVDAGDEVVYFWGRYADENKNYEIDKNGKKKKVLHFPMLAADWKLVSFEVTDLQNEINTLEKTSRMAGRWQQFYEVVSGYTTQKDYFEELADMGDDKWAVLFYYFNKTYETITSTRIRRFTLKKSKIPGHDFFEEFIGFFEESYPTEDKCRGCFEKLSGYDLAESEVSETLDAVHMQKESIIDEKYERYQLDYFSDKYHVDAIILDVEKYFDLMAKAVTRVIASYFELPLEEDTKPKDAKLKEMTSRIYDMFMRKQKIRGTGYDAETWVRKRLEYWERGEYPDTATQLARAEREAKKAAEIHV